MPFFRQIWKKDDKVMMKLCGKLAELMMITGPKIYWKYVTIENGIPVLYVELLKALHGTLKSMLLFYKKLVKDLTSFGFKINPYDVCVANKIINNKQMTMCWHIDDMKISHVDKNEVTKMIKWLKFK